MNNDNAAGDRHQKFLFAGTTVDILVSSEQTRNAFSLLRITNPPGCWTPPHLHRDEAETVFVLSGTLQVATQAGTLALAPGGSAVLPRDQPHRLGTTDDAGAVFLVLCTPGGFDGFVRAAGRPVLGQAVSPALTEADIACLMATAPQYGITMLDGSALQNQGVNGGMHAPPVLRALDVLGVTIETIAELGPDADSVGLLRGIFPPGAMLPLHSHADHETVYVLKGELEVMAAEGNEAVWAPVRPGGVVDIPGGTRHALRNRGPAPAEVLLVATMRIAGLFHDVGVPAGTAPAGLPSDASITAFLAAARERGFWLEEARPPGSAVDDIRSLSSTDKVLPSVSD
jgi:quercetin dioxygenase-like cupin family protein